MSTENNADNRILVTGATGCLGRAVAARLSTSSRNFLVTALGRNQAVGETLHNSRTQFIPCDLKDVEQLPEKFSAIIHCAALSSPWGSFADFYRTNVAGTQHVIALALKQNCPLVHISTPSVYFNFQDRLAIKEEDPLATKWPSPYTESKWLAEQEILKARIQGLQAVILRPRGIFGPHDSGVLPRILKLAKRGYFPKMRPEDRLIDVTYVDNVAQSIELVLAHFSTVEGHTFNITNGEPMALQQLLSALFHELDLKVRFVSLPYNFLSKIAFGMEQLSTLTSFGEPPLTRYSVGLLAFAQTLDISKARKLLCYQPEVSVFQGIKRFARWYLSFLPSTQSARRFR